MAIKPIKPSEVQSEKDTTIPDEIIEATNNLIVKRWDGNHAIIKQDHIVEAAMRLFKQNGKEHTRDELFDNRWMDIESVFQKAGWKVTYDGPGYNETYPATFEFSRKRGR